MSEIEVRMTCPLGSECESAKDGYIERCAWYTKIQGHDPQTNEPLDEWRCAMQWMPLLQVETTGAQGKTSATVESFRNEMVKDNAAILGTVALKKITG